MAALLEHLLYFITRLLTGAVADYGEFRFEPLRQRIYYANHSSHMDTLILWSMLPKLHRLLLRSLSPSLALLPVLPMN